jgi:hypothetical protein
VGFEASTPKAPQKLKGFAKSYFLIKKQDIEVEKFKGENSGNKYVSLVGSIGARHLVS